MQFIFFDFRESLTPYNFYRQRPDIDNLYYNSAPQTYLHVNIPCLNAGCVHPCHIIYSNFLIYSNFSVKRFEDLKIL